MLTGGTRLYNGQLTGAKTIAVDPNSATGGALVITNAQSQTSGSLVTFTGKANALVLSTTGDVHHSGKLTATLGLHDTAGNKVVGAQQSAIADATAEVTSLKAQLNAVLSILRAHGLIAAA